MRRLLLAALLALACGPLATAPASAHKPSDSYLVLDVRNGVISGQWDIALRDLDHAIGLDGDDDGALTWHEVRGHHDAIAAFALSHLRISRGDARCATGAVSHLIDEHSDGAYAVLRFDVRCPSTGGPVRIEYSLFFDLDPQHRGLLRLIDGDGTLTAIFSPSQPTIALDADAASPWRQLVDYVEEGVWHIWIGFDHILFLLTLLLPSVLLRDGSGWRPVARFRQAFVQVLKIVTAFTVAHSLTLSLAVLGAVTPPSRLVESLIAFSVMIAGANNVVPVVTRYLWGVAFGFGLIHGFGFASVLVDLGLPRSALTLALFGFNLGVELGQLALVAAFLPFAFLLRRTGGYRRWLMPAGSLTVAGIATLWLVERSLDVRVAWV
ncbi:MAG: HupE/UreJ family protein [Betaproteobacteria bacterium]